MPDTALPSDGRRILRSVNRQKHLPDSMQSTTADGYSCVAASGRAAAGDGAATAAA